MSVTDDFEKIHSISTEHLYMKNVGFYDNNCKKNY